MLETDWVNISEDAKSLIKQMLRYDQTNRISAEEALNNKWIKRNSKNNMISNKAIQNLSYFHVINIKYNKSDNLINFLIRLQTKFKQLSIHLL